MRQFTTTQRKCALKEAHPYLGICGESKKSSTTRGQNKLNHEGCLLRVLVVSVLGIIGTIADLDLLSVGVIAVPNQLHVFPPSESFCLLLVDAPNHHHSGSFVFPTLQPCPSSCTRSKVRVGFP